MGSANVFDPSAVNSFLKIFNFDKKRELERYCRDVVVHRRALAAFILACEAGVMPLRHHIHSREYRPEQLVPSQKEREALADNGVGELKGDALKMVRKVGQLFRDRRLLVGHMFETPDLSMWHLFYFDQRDLEDDDPNHWKEGPHVHLINWLLWPNHDAQLLWSAFTSGNVQLSGALHLRFAGDRPHPPDSEA